VCHHLHRVFTKRAAHGVEDLDAESFAHPTFVQAR
jgi:hypothetical protein